MLDSIHKKTVYTVFKDCIIISTYNGESGQVDEGVMVRIERFPFQTVLGTRPGLRTQPCYEVLLTFRSKQLKCSDYDQVSEAVALRMIQSWQWGSQIAVKKINKIPSSHLLTCWPLFHRPQVNAGFFNNGPYRCYFQMFTIKLSQINI